MRDRVAQILIFVVPLFAFVVLSAAFSHPVIRGLGVVVVDEDRSEGCIRDLPHAYTRDGGLAVLYGNLAPEGSIIKTAGVPEELWRFSGPAKVFETPVLPVSNIINARSKALPVRFDVALHDLPAGKYNFQVTVLNPASQKAAFWQAPVLLVP